VVWAKREMLKNQSALVLGGGVFLALLSLGLGWFFFLRPKNVKVLTNSDKKKIVDKAFTPKSAEAEQQEEEDEEDEEEVEEEAEEIVSEVFEKVSSSAVVRDEEESDEEEEDQEAALKQAYDDALRLAKKFLSGNQYTKAANKFSDAIDLADKIPSASKDIVTLYNNRRSPLPLSASLPFSVSLCLSLSACLSLPVSPLPS
jgi:ATP-dependent exoDNAse (exonuclease V) alpha subunit